MVLKFNVVSKLGLVGGVILLGSLVVGSTAMAQTNPSTEAPFIGFRPFGGGESVSGSNSRAVTNAVAGAINTQAPAPTQTTITPERPASAYPYPASGGLSFGGVSNSPTGTVERTSIGGRLPNGTIPTGGLNSVVVGTSGQAAGVVPVPNMDPALWQRYQQELQQQQTQQQQQQTQQQQQQAQQQYQQFQQWQYQQYQQWLAQQEQSRLQRQSSSVGFRLPQAPATRSAAPVANRATQQTAATPVSAPQGSATRASVPQASAARSATPRLNQAVVQQVSSTATGSRDSAVARAAWPSSVAPATTNTSVAKQATSVVAKPQCCCVPQRCCVAAPAPVPAPTTPAPVFRPQAVNQAANQIPTLAPSVGSTFGGFLGQAGANYQVQPQGSQLFQSGLGVPQFRSTGALGNGGWFSNGLFGTGAYTPLLPIASAQGARLGQGIIGQPTAYMDGQPIRNLLRYIFP